MFDAFTRVVSQADAEGKFLTSNQLEQLSSAIAEVNKRLDAVNSMTSNASSIVANAARALFEEQPELIAPGGNAYTNHRMAACLRDLEIILRYITYAIFTGDSSVLHDRCLNGLRETYVALGVPGASVALAIQKMKEATFAIILDQLINSTKTKTLELLAIPEIKKRYPRQWVTIEVTKFNNGFPSEGKVLFHD